MSAATALGPQAVAHGIAQAVPLANVGVVAGMVLTMAAIIISSSTCSIAGGSGGRFFLPRV